MVSELDRSELPNEVVVKRVVLRLRLRLRKKYFVFR